jgi:hypothetical protein
MLQAPAEARQHPVRFALVVRGLAEREGLASSTPTGAFWIPPPLSPEIPRRAKNPGSWPLGLLERDARCERPPEAPASEILVDPDGVEPADYAQRRARRWVSRKPCKQSRAPAAVSRLQLQS